MSGRDPLPGEQDPYGGLRDGQQYLNRIVRGQVVGPNGDEGYATVRTAEVVSEREVTLPCFWMSVKGIKTAWGRYMPIGGERVHVGYRNNDTPVVLGYDAQVTKDGSEGWGLLKEAQEQNVVGLANFRKLKGGEFDFKSSGDAYIHGSNMGTLSLYGGQAFIKLDKQAYRIESKALEQHFTSESSEMRVGTVFRKLTPASMAESMVAQGIFKEFLINLNKVNPATGMATPGLQPIAKLHFGHILQDVVNTPELSLTTGSPLCGRILLGDTTGALPAFSLEIDQGGNVVWEQPSPTAAIGLKIALKTAPIEIESLAGNMRLNGLTIKLGALTATEPVPCGNLLVQSLTDFVTNVFITNASSFGVGTYGPVMLNPAVVVALNQWLAAIANPATNFNSLKVSTEKGP